MTTFLRRVCLIGCGITLLGSSLTSRADVLSTPVHIGFIPPLQTAPEYLSIDVLRLNAGYSVHQDVHGFDFGLVSRTEGNQEGVALAGWHRVEGRLRGVQLGVVTSIGGELLGLQGGLFNFSEVNSGMQFGLVNHAETVADGMQIGLVNVASLFAGRVLQVGLINVSTELPRRILPLVQARF